MHKQNGEIYAHEQNGYPDDPTKRSDEGNEHVEQARRYARYYVYRERGYDTLSNAENPGWIAAVGGVVGNLSPEEFEAYFGDYYQQFRYHVTGEGQPQVELPETVDEQTFVAYCTDVYLDLDAEALLDEDVITYFGEAADHLAGSTGGLFDQLRDLADSLGVDDVQPFELDATSAVELLYQGTTEEHYVGGSSPRAREPDARLELSPVDPGDDEYLSIEGFQALVVHHLLCQVRDCYLLMGLEPPEEYRVLGMGSYEASMRYEHRPLYENYHYTSADVDGYFDFETGGPFQLGNLV
ncbi:hypothetical protein [Halopiger djelfimassiliensis]|uniref:hypothetical protein n=1 Tax=Halopiger djelfimassiliensis TaxID=1293047 RepID=UPI0006777F46|nr:hypothetical protein [Halopiger djelfimassiliensis]